MKDMQQALVAAAERQQILRSKRSVPISFKRKCLLKSQQLVTGVRHRTDKWVPVELNDRWEQQKEKFIMWYYFLVNLLEDLEIVTNGFRNFLLEYRDKIVVDVFINLAARQQVKIMAPLERSIPPLIRRSFVDRAKIEREYQVLLS